VESYHKVKLAEFVKILVTMAPRGLSPKEAYQYGFELGKALGGNIHPNEPQR